MSDTPKSFLELDDAPVKIQPNASIFTPASSLQVAEGSTAKQDNNGNTIDSKNVKSTVAANDISTGTLTSGVLYNVSVVVTSQKTATNTATKTFKVARK